MSLRLTIHNRQRTRAINLRLLREITTELLIELLQLDEVELGVALVGAKEMARVNWEFFAVVSGQCAPVLPKQENALLKANTLWVFAPGSAHGWTGNEKHRAYITAFHFGVVPPQLEAAVLAQGHLVLPLDWIS